MVGKPTATPLAQRASSRLAAPAAAFCSTTTKGTRQAAAASPQATEA